MADTLASSQSTSAPSTESALAPLPHRVAEADGHPIEIADPIAFATELLERTKVLLATLEHDVEHLRADRAEERQRIEESYVAECDALEAATDRLGHLQASARQIAAQKGKAALLDSALRLGPTLSVAEVDEPGAFAKLVGSLEAELRAATGITGGIRMPEIGRLLNDAALAVARMGQRADHLKQRLLERTDDELEAEGTEARASFEIGLGVLERDLELLDQALPLAAHAWSDAGWDTWEPIDSLGSWTPVVRLGTYVHPEMPDVAIPSLVAATGSPGLLIEAAGNRDAAVEVVRGLVLRLLTATPPGGARFSFVDPNGLGEAIAPFLGLAEYDADLVPASALSLEGEIEDHLAELTRHIEWVMAHHLQGRYASLDELHAATGEIVEAYRYLVVFDHPTAFSERSIGMLRAIIESGSRCGVTVIVLRQGAPKGRAARSQAITGLTVVKAGPQGLTQDLGRAGVWSIAVDQTPELTVAETGEPNLFERITTATGALARQAQRTPVSSGAVFDLLARAQRRRVRDDLPVTSRPVDPGEPTTWWTGDGVAGLGAPLGRTEDRALASLWFDRDNAGVAVLGAAGRGVSTALHAIVTGLAVLYPPEELQMLLVGLGERRELAVYGTARLPHAVLVASHAERELGGAVLDAAVRELDRREARFGQAGTGRLGLAGHRARTGDQLARLLVVVDGLGELFAVDDSVAAAATRDLRRLAEDGPTVGLHLVLADRCGPDPADESICLDRVPAEITTVLRFASHDDGGWQPGDATLGPRSGAGVAMRTMWIDPHEVAADVRDLRRLADERDVTGGPQVISGDEGAELTSAPLARLVGDEAERASRRSVRLWLGEPSALGAPVEVQLRRQDGANLLVVSSADVAPGVVFAGLVTARIAHGPTLETWALDLGALDEGFAEAVASVATEPPIRAARKRSAVRMLSSVRTQIAERHEASDFDGPPGLLVVHGLGRGPAGDGAAGQFEILAEILRRGPEVGIHTIVSCDSLAQFDVRLGLAALAEFGVCVVTAMDEHDSATLLDSTYATSLRPGHALLADEERGRLIKFRPYVLPPRGWSAPVS